MASLTVRFSQTATRRDIFFYALKAEIVEASGMPSKVFVYHQMPPSPDGNSFAEFDHVASPVDLQEIPEDAATEIVPWYRTDKLVVWLRNLDDLATAKQLIIDDINLLQKTYDVLNSENSFTRQEAIEFSNGSVISGRNGDLSLSS